MRGFIDALSIAQPGQFVINAEGALQLIDILNAPFVRPQLKTLLGGTDFMRKPENNYPIRSTHTS